jgi:hypothetical protein
LRGCTPVVDKVYGCISLKQNGFDPVLHTLHTFASLESNNTGAAEILRIGSSRSSLDPFLDAHQTSCARAEKVCKVCAAAVYS